MATQIIGRLQRIPLREVWRHEAYDFSNNGTLYVIRSHWY